MKELVKISIVSYLNAKPFYYGLRNSQQLIKSIRLSLDVPSICATKLANRNVDIGLVPVASIPSIENARIITPFCIGSSGAVKSVLLVSDVPVEQLHKIYLDTESVTSVALVKILARELWSIGPEWVDKDISVTPEKPEQVGNVIIGDKAITASQSKKYVYDLSEEWMKLTGLPFVFAVWVANRDLPTEFISEFG